MFNVFSKIANGAFSGRFSYFDLLIILVLVGVFGSLNIITIIAIVVIGAFVSNFVRDKAAAAVDKIEAAMGAKND